jgi:ADP-heptose:LPS heptosyltransferase
MRLLVLRTSAMGDVALVTPVLKELNRQFPDIEITLLTRSPFNKFFSPSDRLKIFTPDFRGRHKGIPGLLRLYSDLKKAGRIDHVIDLHDVIRSRILRFFFRLGGTPVSVIDKGRKEKRGVITGKRKVQLRHTVSRYCDVFAKAGFVLDPSDKQSIVPSAEGLNKATEILGTDKVLNIGVAPYALHKLKIWPVEKMIELMRMISEKRDARFFLFGGKNESDRLEKIKKKNPDSVNLAGELSLDEELALMSKLDFMIAMDSSNMHMAALAGTTVISIWGGTDPLNGFGAWMQPADYSVRIPVEELTCRPCTVYGKGECARGDFACMNWLSPDMVMKKIMNAGLLDQNRD